MRNKLIKKGFTLVEVLLVLGLMSIFAVLTMPMTVSWAQKKKLNEEAKEIVSTIFAVQQKAYAGKDNSSYGIRIESNKLTAFTGDSFATGTNKTITALSSQYSINSISFELGGDQVIFELGKFRPKYSGNFRITDGYVSYLIDINKEGLITYSL